MTCLDHMCIVGWPKLLKIFVFVFAFAFAFAFVFVFVFVFVFAFVFFFFFFCADCVHFFVTSKLQCNVTCFLRICYMMSQAGHAVTMLSEQYRMHPAISAWPSLFFYQGKLSDATSALPGAGASRAADFHKRPCFPPLAFFDCRRAGLLLNLLLGYLTCVGNFPAWKMSGQPGV